MAKNKRHKYERVKHLPNVSFSVFGRPGVFCTYPWYHDRYKDTKTILELGCGKGEHSLALAAANPYKLYVGIDYKSHRICVGAEKALEQGLENLFFLRARIERITEFFIKQSIDEIWLTFPDPHLKNREIKSRLSAAPFLDLYAHLLVPKGVVHLKTDNDQFFKYTRECVNNWGGHVVEVLENLHKKDYCESSGNNIVSTFESKALSKGLAIKYMAFTL